MKTRELYYQDINLLNFTATIVDIIEKENKFHIILDNTAFYPESGGMPSDEGTIGGIVVESVIKKNSVIYHILPDKPIGDTVTCQVNHTTRIKHIQFHDAQHLLSALLEKNYNLLTVSHHVYNDYCDLVLEGEQLTDQIIKEVEYQANKLIYERKKLDVFLLPKKDLHLFDLKDNPKYSDPVRITNIETINDYNACGCLHFDNLASIQLIKCLKVEKLNNQYRLVFSAGSALIDYVGRISKNYEYAKSLLKANDDNFIAMIGNLSSKNKDLSKNLEETKIKFYTLLVEQLAAKSDFFVYELDEVDYQDLKTFTTQVINANKPLYALIQVKRGEKYQFSLVKQKECEYSLDNLFVKLKNDYDINGGGRGLSITGQSPVDLISIIDKYL